MSIVLAGFFGTLGLLTKYRDKNDNITRHGRIALGGIIFTAVLSLALQLLQTSKESVKQREDAIRSAAEARKSEASAKETSKRLEDILSTAKDTSDQQTKNLAQAEILTDKMDKSLIAQQDVLSGNKEILTGVVQGAKRDTKNTIGILKTVWNESNRVDASQVAAHINYTFLKQTVKRPPLLFASEEQLLVSLHPVDATAFPSNQWNQWSEKGMLSNGLMLGAGEQKALQFKHRSVDGVQYEQRSYFSDFRGDVREFSDMTKWNGALVEVWLRNNDPELLKALGEAMEWQPDPIEDWIVFERYHSLPQWLQRNSDDYSITPLPILAEITIFVRGRVIATSKAVLVKVTGGDEDVKGLIVAKFKIQQVSVDTFPLFKPSL